MIDVSEIVSSDLCIGCGACSYLNSSRLSMARNTKGFMQPTGSMSKLNADTNAVCPFSNASINEDGLSKLSVSKDLQFRSNEAGRYLKTFFGHSNNNDTRVGASSGGVATEIANYLIANGFVDAIIHAGPSQYKNGELVEFHVSTNLEQIQKNSKSHYSSAAFDKALGYVVQNRLRFAFVGVPCFVKSINNLALVDKDVEALLVLTISLFCGHMKSQSFGLSLSRQLKIADVNVSTIDFRTKREKRKASLYNVTINTIDGKSVSYPMYRLLGSRWDVGFFRANACFYCDDVMGETADISLGDAWTDPYNTEWKGTNAIIVRSKIASDIVSHLKNDSIITTYDCSISDINSTQAGGIRDRREGLAYRLTWSRGKSFNLVKRVSPSREISVLKKLKYRLRYISNNRSFRSFELATRLNTMTPYILEMNIWNFIIRLVNLIERKLQR